MSQEITMDVQWVPRGTTEPRTIRARVSLPEPSPDLGGYLCIVTFDGMDELFGPNDRREGLFHDTHAMMALRLALNMVPHVIEHAVLKAGGRVVAPPWSVDDLDPDEADPNRELLGSKGMKRPGIGMAGVTVLHLPPPDLLAMFNAGEIDPATFSANAIAEAMNALYIVLDWNDRGAAGTPPMDGIALGEVMALMDRGVGEMLHGRRVWTSAPSFTDDDLVRVRQIEAIIPTWPSKGPLPPELVTLGESVFRTITGGATLKEAQAWDRAGRRRS